MTSAGDLLLASPGLHDGIFDRAVIFLLDHSPEGSMGLVLNRPSELRVEEALPTLDLTDGADPVYLGGPVEEGTALVLAEPADPIGADLHYARGGVGLIDLALPEPVQVIRARVFSGYAGWGPRQLETELRSGAWVIAPSREEDLWEDDSDDMWARIMSRSGVIDDFLRQYPGQPWLN